MASPTGSSELPDDKRVGEYGQHLAAAATIGSLQDIDAENAPRGISPLPGGGGQGIAAECRLAWLRAPGWLDGCEELAPGLIAHLFTHGLALSTDTASHGVNRGQDPGITSQVFAGAR